MVMLVLLLLSLTSSVCVGVLAVTWKLYEVEEKDNVTITWDVQEDTDLSLAHLLCFLQSKTVRVLCHVIRGVQQPDSVHQQFAGRVQCQRDAPRRGRVQLHMSTVTPEDTGRYCCDLAISDGQSSGRWLLDATELFVLNVTSHVSAPTQDSQAAAGRPDQSHASRRLEAAGCLLAGLVFITCFVLLHHAAAAAGGGFQRVSESASRQHVSSVSV